MEVEMFKHIFKLIKRRLKRRLLVAIYRKPKTIHASTQAAAQPHIDNYGWPTTRCFPRSTAEAFKDRDYGESFYPPEQRWQDKVFMFVGVCMWIAIGTYMWNL
jgi:hypothetical protein